MRKKANKYKNIKTKVNGIVFDSKKEAKRYKELLEMEKDGKITNLKLQPKYELQPKFRIYGEPIRAITYIADFEYYDLRRNKKIIEDVKGMKTDVYKLKKKLIFFKLKEADDIEFKEITK